VLPSAAVQRWRFADDEVKTVPLLDEDGQPMETLGMSDDAMRAYIEELIQERAQQVADENETTLEEELDTPAFAAIRASMVYAIELIQANNAYLTRHLLDLGMLNTGAAQSDEEAVG
jgi:hypothetical protein